MVVHWRSMSLTVEKALTNGQPNRLSAHQWEHYYTDCAARVAKGAEAARAELVGAASAAGTLATALASATPTGANATTALPIVFFSDIDEAGYVERTEARRCFLLRLEQLAYICAYSSKAYRAARERAVFLLLFSSFLFIILLSPARWKT